MRRSMPRARCVSGVAKRVIRWAAHHGRHPTWEMLGDLRAWLQSKSFESLDETWVEVEAWMGVIVIDHG